MMKGLSTAAQMGAVKVSTIASFSGRSMTATRSAPAPLGSACELGAALACLQCCLLQSCLTAGLGRAQFIMAPYPKMPRTVSRPRLPQQLRVSNSHVHNEHPLEASTN